MLDDVAYPFHALLRKEDFFRVEREAGVLRRLEHRADASYVSGERAVETQQVVHDSYGVGQMAECGVCSTIKLIAAAAQPHKGALEFVASPWSHENREVLTGYVQGNLEVAVCGVETAEVDGVAVNFLGVRTG